ncbi:MAG: glycosyltransferase [Alphaproteobacteria bacterium]|nr:glycosyltransferase [Alphaproteobacteria bacterium]
MAADAMPVKVSILLCSLFEDLFRRALANVFETCGDADYEIVAVTPFEVAAPRVRWVREEQPKGTVYAYDAAYRHSRGDYVFGFNDDSILQPGWLSAVLAFTAERERRYFPYSCGLHTTPGGVGTLFGLYYPYYHFTGRRSVEAVGGWIRTIFKAHFGDGDLAMRIWAAGGRCELCRDSLIAPIEHRESLPESGLRNRRDVIYDDLQTFLREWGERFGRGWDVKLRDFNIDISAACQKYFMADHTIMHNRPEFAAVSRIMAHVHAIAQRKGLRVPDDIWADGTRVQQWIDAHQ